METISRRQARRLALVRAGLLQPRWTGLSGRAAGRGARARRGALAVVRRYGYLQLDTIAVSGARSHVIVLLSRLRGLDPEVGEALLAPGEPLFEYWGHEASWLPIELYPTFDFRRREFRVHPWWGDVLGEHPEVADRLLARIRDEGPLRSADFEGERPQGDGWYPKVAKRVASALWSRGDLAVRERRGFQRVWDLAERVIPPSLRGRSEERPAALRRLLLQALEGQGWAQTGTLTATWRLRNLGGAVAAALAELEEAGEIVACALEDGDGRCHRGWIRPQDLELAERVVGLRPRQDRGVLLSPFDPVLWDRARVRKLFGFEQVLEIFKPVAQRVYGYYCLPVLAGDRLIGRVDLKADRRAGRLELLSLRYEAEPVPAAHRRAVGSALEWFGGALGLAPPAGAAGAGLR